MNDDDDKLVTVQRRAILTYVPAEVRMRVCGELRKKKRLYFSITPLIIGLILIGYSILNYMLGGDPFVYGYIAGCGVMSAVTLALFYKIADKMWLPPTNEEMNELGDELI